MPQGQNPNLYLAVPYAILQGHAFSNFQIFKLSNYQITNSFPLSLSIKPAAYANRP